MSRDSETYGLTEETFPVRYLKKGQVPEKVTAPSEAAPPLPGPASSSSAVPSSAGFSEDQMEVVQKLMVQQQEQFVQQQKTFMENFMRLNQPK